jgi:broad specificity phosphatase PhoE
MAKEAVAPSGISAAAAGEEEAAAGAQRRKRALVATVVLAVLVAAGTAVVLAVALGDGGRSADASVPLAEYAEKPFGDVLIMRHALAPGGGDPPGFLVGNCSTQRNLGAAGIEQATGIGEKLAASAVRLGKTVYTSQWCRCRDSARLIVGRLNARRNNNSAAAGEYFSVEEEWGLNSFYQPERGGFTEAACMKRLEESVLGRLRAIPVGERDGAVTLMVTHKVTVSAVTGIDVDSGAIVAYDSKTGEAKRLEL